MRVHVFVEGLIIAGCISSSTVGQSSHSNPWAPTEDGPLPPIASLTDGVWLKGDLHVHSRHSKDSSNNPEAKIISFHLSANHPSERTTSDSPTIWSTRSKSGILRSGQRTPMRS
jgi:hypothetical protein